MKSLAVAALALCLIAAPGFAQETPPAAPAATAAEGTATPTAPAAEPEKEKRICKSTKVTGSMIGKRRICKTKAEWEAQTVDQERTIREMAREMEPAMAPLPSGS